MMTMIWFFHRALESEGRRRILSGGCSGSGSVGDDDDVIVMSSVYECV